MKKGTSTVILAAAIGISGFTSVLYADHDDDRRDEQRHEDRRSDRTDHREYRDALKNLQDARRTLSSVAGDWEGRRKEALTQTNYAIEQVYAAIGDDAAKARDQQLAARELDQGREQRDRNRDQSVDRRRRDMNTALDHLRSARRELDRVPGDDSRQRKSVEFTDQAIKDVQTALAELR